VLGDAGDADGGGQMRLAGARRTNNILPINILPKSPSNTAFTRAMANG